MCKCGKPFNTFLKVSKNPGTKFDSNVSGCKAALSKMNMLRSYEYKNTLKETL